MKKRYFLFALVLVTLLQSCTGAQAVNTVKEQPWEWPLRWLGF